MDTSLNVMLIVSLLSVFILGLMGVRTLNAMHVDIAKYLVSFVKLKLYELDFKSQNFEHVVDVIIQSIIYNVAAKYPSQNLTLSDKYINKATEFVLNHLKQAEISLTEMEINIIKNTLKSAFSILEISESIKIITEKNFLRIYRNATNHMKIETPKFVGLRKIIK